MSEVLFSNPPRATPRLFVYAPPSELETIAPITMSNGFGAVYVADSRSGQGRLDALAQAAMRHLEITGTLPQLDPNYYSGKARRYGNEPLSLTWAQQQERLGLAYAFTDSGFIHADRMDQLNDILIQAKHLQQHLSIPVVAMLPLDHLALQNHASQISDLINTHQVTAAILAGHQGDPFGSRKAVGGLIEILRAAETPVWLMRSDLSALGAISVGAPVVGVGTSPSLRHVFTNPGKRAGGRAAGDPAVLIETALAWRTLGPLIDVIGAYPDEVVWTCLCDTHYGRRLDSVRTESDLAHHNYNVVARLLDHIVTSPDPAKTWLSMAGAAQSTILTVAAETGMNWEAPPSLGAWWSTQPVSAGN